MTPQKQAHDSSRAHSARKEDVSSPYLSNSRPASSRPVSSQPSTRGPPASSRVQSASTNRPDSATTRSDKLLLEQIARLQEQCHILEKESKEAEITMQETIKQNRQTWMAIKQENKQLKQQLMQRRTITSQATAAEEQAARTTSSLERKVHELRRHYDKIMQDKKTAVAKLANCQDNVQELHKTMAVSGSPGILKSGNSVSSISSTMGAALPWSSKEGRAIRQLENRLTKAQLKANEAQSIRRTYEQVLDKVWQEQLGFGPYVQSLEAALKAKDNEHSRLTQALVEAQHAKERAKQELATFQSQMAQQRAARESVLHEQRAKASTLGAANRALLAQQFGLKEVALQADLQQHHPLRDQQQTSNPQQSQAQQPALVAGERAEQSQCLQGELGGEVGPLAGGGLSRSSTHRGGAQGEGGQGKGGQRGEGLEDMSGTKQHGHTPGETVKFDMSTEEVVQRLCEAALAPDAQAMLDRMLPRQETYTSLTAMHTAAMEQEAQLSRELDAARQALHDVQHGVRSNTTQAYLDAAQAELTAALQKAEAAKESHANTMRAYVDVRAGLEHIASMLVQLPLPPGQLPVPMSEDTLGDVLAQSHQRLAAALKFIHTLPKAGALLDKLVQDQDSSNWNE